MYRDMRRCFRSGWWCGDGAVRRNSGDGKGSYARYPLVVRHGLRNLPDLRAWVIVFVGTELGYAGEVAGVARVE